MAIRSRRILGSSSAVNSRFASSATRRTSSIDTLACSLITSHPSLAFPTAVLLAFHFKVYPGDLYSRYPRHLASKLCLHTHQLTQPGSVSNLYMNHSRGKTHHASPLRQRLAAGHGPRRGESIFIPHCSQASS